MLVLRSRRRLRRRADHGGQTARRTRETAYKREDIAQGMPVDRLYLWYLPPAFLSAGGPWVRPSPGIPCTLCTCKRDMMIAQLGRHMPREREVMSSAV